MSATDATIERYRARFAAQGEAAPAWLAALRRRGLDALDVSGLPTPKWEDWKNTNLNALRRALDAADTTPAGAPAAVDAIPAVLADDAAHRLVFVDGALRPDLSSPAPLPDGVVLQNTAAATAEPAAWLQPALEDLEALEELPLAALNTAFLGDGYVLRLADGAVLDRPLEVVHLATGGQRLLQPRNLVLAGRNSQATVVESYVSAGTGGYLSNAVTQVVCADGARLARCKLQDEAADASHVALLAARLRRDASFDNFELTLGGALARSESRVALQGPGATLRLDGVYLGRGRQQSDTSTWIDHRAGQTSSEEVYKGVLDDRAHAIFRGRISVQPDAQQISGHQLNKTLLLSDQAEIDSKPELEILADDVKCSHGATAGALDQDALFYLRSRGIPEREARGMLIASFLAEAVERIASAPLRDAFGARTAGWLEAGEERTGS